MRLPGHGAHATLVPAGDGVQEREGCEAVDAHAAVGTGGCDDGEGGVRRGLPGARAGGRGEGCEGGEGAKAWG